LVINETPLMSHSLIFSKLIAAYFSLMLFLLTATRLSGQPTPQLAGNWTGTINAGGQKLGVVFTVSQTTDGPLKTTMAVPAQGAKGIPCDQTLLQGDSLTISVKAIGGQFSGKLNAARTEAIGQWQQGGAGFPLMLNKADKVAAVKAPERPQTPKGPFHYVSEDVEYDNPAKTVHLGATLTKPNGPGPFPVVVLITGSGAQDRDETILGHKPFWVIADYLTRRGVAVLRVDDRGVGKSRGNRTQATSADYAQDVITSLDFLKKRPDINPKQIGLIGHSEGGMIAPMVAAERPKDVAFIVMLAGPGAPCLDGMVLQNVAVIKGMGASEAYATQYGELYRVVAKGVLAGKDSVQRYQLASVAFEGWKAKQDPILVSQLLRVRDEATKQAFLVPLVNALSEPWFRYFLAYDPTANLRKLRCPVLALNGEKDVQVDAALNLSAIEKTTSTNKRVTIKAISNLNHLFQHCQTCTPAEYEELTETFDPETLKTMGDWISGVIH
jgi:uncharacterized protein